MFARCKNFLKPLVIGSTACIAIANYSTYSFADAKTDTSFADTYQNNLVSTFRPHETKYERIDLAILEDKFEEYRNQHVLYSTLLADSRIETYEIYKSKDDKEILCILKFGDKINGWPNIVHGGITALMIDNSYGWLFTTFEMPPAVTANLTVNYKRPILANSYSILKAKIEKIQGKKLYMSATIEEAGSGKIQAESTTLFIFVSEDVMNGMKSSN